ncbi:MAG: HEAT repeat domain-containing protein [Planctomycetota bacterium]
MRTRIFISAVVLVSWVASALAQDSATPSDDQTARRLEVVKGYVAGIPDSTFQNSESLAPEARNVQNLCGGKDILPFLRQVLTDPQVDRTKIFRIVAVLKPEGTEAFLAESLNHGKTEKEKEAALGLLAENGSDTAMRLIILAASTHSDRATRDKAKNAIHGSLAGPRERFVAVLRGMAASKSEPASARMAAMRVLETMPGADVNAILLEQVDHSDEAVRVAALRALTARGDQTASRLMLSLIHDDPSDHVRRQAAYGMARIGGKASIPKLIGALTDSDVVVQRIALRSLQELTGQVFGADRELWTRWWEKYDSNLATLIDMLQDENDGNVLRALRLLEKERLNRAKVSREIAPLVRHESPRVQQAALIALGRLGEETNVPILLHALSDEDSQTVLAALAALGKVSHQREKIAEAVAGLIDDQDDAVASAAQKLLRTLPRRAETVEE